MTFSNVPLPTTPALLDSSSAPQFARLIQEAVSQRAYQLFKQSGDIPGRDPENWRQAESEILRGGLNLRNKGLWISVTGELPGISPEKISILVDARRVVVRAGLPSDVFFILDLGADVEAASAIASLKNNHLRLMVKKRREVANGV